MLPVESQLKLRKIDLNERNFVPNKFSTEPMELNQFIEKMGLDFGADCAFCQYSNANEVLSEENEILLMSTVCITLLLATFSMKMVYSYRRRMNIFLQMLIGKHYMKS